MIITQSTEGIEIPVLVKDVSGNPVTGLAVTDLVIQIWKSGMDGFGNAANYDVVTPANSLIREIGFGYYAYTIGVPDTDTLGELLIRVSSSTNVGVVQATIQPAVSIQSTPTTTPVNEV